MTFEELSILLKNANASEWISRTCAGGGGPSYKNHFKSWHGSDGSSGVEIESHAVIAVLKKDLRVSLAWGMPNLEDFSENWTDRFPDKHASSCFVDFFFNSNLVFREIGVNVDGGRCMLPLPKLQFPEHSNPANVHFSLSRERFEFYRVLNELESPKTDYDVYLYKSQIELVDEPWLE